MAVPADLLSPTTLEPAPRTQLPIKTEKVLIRLLVTAPHQHDHPPHVFPRHQTPPRSRWYAHALGLACPQATGTGATRMKKFIRDNPTIAFGLGLPLLLVAVPSGRIDSN